MLLSYKNLVPRIAATAFVEDSARLIGDVAVGEQSSVWFNVVVRADVNSVRIGSFTNIQDGSVVHVARDRYPTMIGSYVTVGHNATLHGCTIEDHCLIGMGAVILDGSHIGENTIVAAGTLLAPGTIIPPASLVMGSPGVPKRPVRAEEIQNIHNSAQNYVKLMMRYLHDVRIVTS